MFVKHTISAILLRIFLVSSILKFLLLLFSFNRLDQNMDDGAKRAHAFRNKLTKKLINQKKDSLTLPQNDNHSNNDIDKDKTEIYCWLILLLSLFTNNYFQR